MLFITAFDAVVIRLAFTLDLLDAAFETAATNDGLSVGGLSVRPRYASYSQFVALSVVAGPDLFNHSAGSRSLREIADIRQMVDQPAKSEAICCWDTNLSATKRKEWHDITLK